MEILSCDHCHNQSSATNFKLTSMRKLEAFLNKWSKSGMSNYVFLLLENLHGENCDSILQNSQR